MVGRVNLVNKLVAKKLSKDEKVVSSVNEFFYNELHNTLKECKHPHIFVKDLGTFTMRLRPVEGRIKLLLAYIRNTNKSETIPEHLRERYVTGMKREIRYLFEVRRLIKTNKKEYKRLKEHGKSIRSISETVDDSKG